MFHVIMTMIECGRVAFTAAGNFQLVLKHPMIHFYCDFLIKNITLSELSTFTGGKRWVIYIVLDNSLQFKVFF